MTMTRWCRYLLNPRQRQWPTKWWWARGVCMCVDKRSEKGTIVCPTDDVYGVYDDGFLIFILFNMIVLTSTITLVWNKAQ